MKPLKAYLNLLLYRLNRFLRCSVINNYPLIAFVDPTTFCNLSCPACPTGVRAGVRTSAVMEMNLYRAFIDEVGDYLFKLYLYNLGEPLLHKEAPEMVAYAKEKDIFVMISTNFSRDYSEDYLERLVSSGLDVLVVALDGTKEESYRQYRRGGNFSLVRKNMLRIQEIKTKLKAKTPQVVWQFLVFSHNDGEIEEVKRVYREWGADDYWIGGGFLPPNAYREGFSSSRLVSFNLYDPRNFVTCNTQKIFAEKKPCTWLYGAVVLSPNGMLSPCCYTPAEKDDFAKYEKGDFMKAWNSPRYVKARELFASGEIFSSQDDLKTVLCRQNGRGLEAIQGLKEGELICHVCPVPYLQDLVEQELKWDDASLLHYLKKETTLSPEESEMLDSALRFFKNEI